MILAIPSANYDFLINSLCLISDLEVYLFKYDVFSGVTTHMDEKFLHANMPVYGAFEAKSANIPMVPPRNSEIPSKSRKMRWVGLAAEIERGEA